MANIQNMLSGKMSMEHFPPTKEKTSVASSKNSQEYATKKVQFLDLRTESGETQEKSWAITFPLHGDYSTLNTGECPNEENASTLWQILQVDAPEKYYLSAKACAGILRRAERRGKKLPPMLREALEEAIALDV